MVFRASIDACVFWLNLCLNFSLFCLLLYMLLFVLFFGRITHPKTTEIQKYRIGGGGSSDRVRSTARTHCDGDGGARSSRGRSASVTRSQTSVSMLMALMLLLWRGLQFCLRANWSRVTKRPSSSSTRSDDDSLNELFFMCCPSVPGR